MSDRLDPKTFGDSPAAIHLASVLSYIGNPKLTRRISKRLSEAFEIMSGLERSHEAGFLSAKAVGAIAGSIEAKMRALAQAIRNTSLDGPGIERLPLCANLAENVLIGRLKSMKRRAGAAKKATGARKSPAKGEAKFKMSDFDQLSGQVEVKAKAKQRALKKGLEDNYYD